MAAIVWTDVTDEAGEFISPATPIGAQTLLLSIVNGAGVNVDNFGGEDADLTKAARVFYCAHLETLRRRRGLAGAIQSQSEGGASQSYWMGFMSPRFLYLTGYGLMLAQICMGTPARAGLLVG